MHKNATPTSNPATDSRNRQPFNTIGTTSSAQYRLEAKRLLDVAESTSFEAKVTLLETARLYEALAEHVEQRSRARS
jgi:hypothetical protein